MRPDNMPRPFAPEHSDPNDGTTHAEGCHTWGRQHHDCAMREIERLLAQIDEQKARITDLGIQYIDWKVRAQDAESERDELRERLPGGPVAFEQAVELAVYVSEHAKGKMVEACERFLSNEHAAKIAARIKAFDDAPVGELVASHVSPHDFAIDADWGAMLDISPLAGKRVRLVVDPGGAV